MELRRRDEHPFHGDQWMQPADVDSGFFVRFAQGGGHRPVIGGIGCAAGESRLPRMVAQTRGAHGEQQVGVVGKAAVGRAGLRAGEQHQHCGIAAVAADRETALAAVTIASTSAGSRRR